MPVQLQALPEATNESLCRRLVNETEWGQVSVDDVAKEGPGWTQSCFLIPGR
jgi:hypothetical protein